MEKEIRLVKREGRVWKNKGKNNFLFENERGQGEYIERVGKMA